MDFSKVDFSKLGQDIAKVAEKEIASFVQANSEAAAKLGTDKVKAILQLRILDQVQAVTALPAGAPLSLVADLEEMLAKRDEVAAVVASAELIDAQRVAALKKSATDTAIGIISKIGAVALGVLTKGLLG